MIKKIQQVNGEVEIQINTRFKKCTPVKSVPNLSYVPETFPVVFCCALWW